jgi:SPP1 family predicted phage head-tail adaptor
MLVDFLQEVCEIQSPTESVNADGVTISSWSTVATEPCSHNQLSGIKIFTNNTNGHAITTEIYVEYPTAALLNYRIVLNGRNYLIEDIDDVGGRNEFVKILCSIEKAV